jgi:adenylate cyclase
VNKNALREIASCFEGAIPATICSCAPDGTPNITFLSIVHMLDDEHVGLSHQFFNKTWRNIMSNPQVQVMVVEPATGRQFRLDLWYQRTVDKGSLFERMRTELDAVASQTGMSDRFKLKGVDIYRVCGCELVAEVAISVPLATDPAYFAGLRAVMSALTGCTDLESLITTALDRLDRDLGFPHSHLLMVDEPGERLYAIASHGYAESGAGAEVQIGEGIIGIAAQRGQPVRIGNMSRSLAMGRAMRDSLERAEKERCREREIPLPALFDVRSQLALPLLAGDHVIGVLNLQSDRWDHFGPSEETVASAVAQHLAAAMALLGADSGAEPTRAPDISHEEEPRREATAVVKRYASDDSVFIDREYLIKGVAGRILWKLLRDYVRDRRREFTNRELRLDATLQLPDYKDNLEARLILLRRRLEERRSPVRLVRSGRGHFRVQADKHLVLEEIAP